MRKFHFASLSQFQRLREPIRDYIYELSPHCADLLFVALNEAVNNALFHGRKDGLSLNIEVEIFREGDDICLVVRHDGIGFNSCQQEKDRCENDADEHGRGLEIIRYCTDIYHFNDAGNELEMRKKI